MQSQNGVVSSEGMVVSVNSEFADFLIEQMADVGPVTMRRMFGGAGLFREGLMFALIADDTLYLKADEESRAEFEREGLPAFTYETSGGRRTVMSYWRAPERCLEDVEEMTRWCRLAHDAALRSARPKKPRRVG